jgi:hypothetical protein
MRREDKEREWEKGRKRDMYRDNARQRERHKGRRRKILIGGERGRMKEQEKEW